MRSCPSPRSRPQALHAVDAIIAAARAHAGRLILCATGPLTNIALALMREPELPRLVKRFVIMGGAYAEPGNVTPAAEFNIWHDPEAARIVFRSFGGVGAAPVIAIGLDVTRKTIIDEGDLAAIASRVAGKPHAPALTRFLDDASRFYFERMEKMLRPAHLHDARPARGRRRARPDPGRDAPRRRRRRDNRAGSRPARRSSTGAANGAASPTPKSRSRSMPSASAACSSTRWLASPTGHDGSSDRSLHLYILFMFIIRALLPVAEKGAQRAEKTASALKAHTPAWAV